MSEEQRSDEGSSKKLPPGMVLGPDGKPCKVCTAMRYWKPPKAASAKREVSNGNSTSKEATIASVFNQSVGALAISNLRENCPPDVEQLGRATWTFLHTTAAYYPEKPTPTQRANMLSLIRAIPILYPCWHCADDFGKEIAVNPPDVSGRIALSKWFCERHNDINEKLGKSKFDCLKTDERWKTGPEDSSCD